tara:strand:+ start:12180 stop:13379 length:1200 start_codon:yes stop_codon:yes gene_type:complete
MSDLTYLNTQCCFYDDIEDDYSHLEGAGPCTGFSNDCLDNGIDSMISKFMKSIHPEIDELNNKQIDNKQVDEILDICPKASDIRISTITAICSIDVNINLNVVLQCLGIDHDIRYIEYGKDTKGIPVKKISKKKLKKKKIFYNQATIIVYVDKYVNTKIFRNGKVQMTGLKSIEHGHKVVSILINKLKTLKQKESIYNDIMSKKMSSQSHDSKIYKTNDMLDKINKNGEYINAVDDVDNIKMVDFKIVLINTDFNANFKINRSALHQIMINNYKLFCKYEPCIYPGVDTKYYWNNYHIKDGLCHCKKKCNGKGYGFGENDCKKITIAIFQSGSIIITGARNMDQVKDAKTFISKILEKHYKQTKKILPSFIINHDLNNIRKRKSKKYYIKKSLVTNIYS